MEGVIIKQVIHCFMTSECLLLDIEALRQIAFDSHKGFAFFALISLKKDTLKVFAFELSSITFYQNPVNCFQIQ